MPELTTTEAEPDSVAPIRSVMSPATGLVPWIRLVGSEVGCELGDDEG